MRQKPSHVGSASSAYTHPAVLKAIFHEPINIAGIAGRLGVRSEDDNRPATPRTKLQSFLESAMACNATTLQDPFRSLWIEMKSSL